MDKKQKLIEGVVVTNLRQIEDERGAVFHVLKNTDPHFNKFGEVYISKVNLNVIKGWKYHKEMTQNFSVPYGVLKLVLVDLRPNSPTFEHINEFIMEPEGNYKMVSLPSKLWYGFKCLSDSYCLLLNIASMKHDPSESMEEDISVSKINYQW